MNVPNMWLVRYCAVFAAALLLTVSYKEIISFLPLEIAKTIGRLHSCREISQTDGKREAGLSM